MDYITEIFTRLDIQHIREFLMHGEEESNIGKESYHERLERAEKRAISFLRLIYTNNEEYEELTRPVALTYYFLPNIKNCLRGYILNAASIAALYPLPYGSIYGASKAFVLSFTKALRCELRKTNITISCLCPGDTDTNFMINAGGEKLNFTMAPQEVAKIAVKSLLKRKSVIFPKQVKIISKFPKPVLTFIVSKITSKYSNNL